MNQQQQMNQLVWLKTLDLEKIIEIQSDIH